MRTRRSTTWLLVAAVGVIALSCPPAGRLAAQQTRSLDEQLLDDLGDDPVDEFDRELFGPDEKQQKAGDATGQTIDDLKDRLQRELGKAAVAEDDNPLLAVARRMREVEGLIARNDSGPTTQDMQTQIVADLEELIKRARKGGGQGKPGSKAGTKPGPKRPSDSPPGPPRPKKGSGGGKQPGPTVAGAHDKPNPGLVPPQRPDMEEMGELLKQLWGQLPQRERERMLQSPPEEFLPKYELLIEAYFRRLAEEKE